MGKTWEPDNDKWQDWLENEGAGQGGITRNLSGR